MKQNKNISYKCIECGTPTVTLHEIFMSKNRKLSHTHNLQAPLCARCHNIAHGKHDGHFYRHYDLFNQEQCAKDFCMKLGLNYDDTKLAVNISDYNYLINIEDDCKKKLEEWQI